MCESMDVTICKQKMLFWMDMSNRANADPTIPTKKRLWLIVSNDEINRTSANFTVVPVYSGTECTKNTHVAFKNGDHDCVIKCENINTVARWFIKRNDYEGIISDELWAKVQTALINQFTSNMVINTTAYVANTNTTTETSEDTTNDTVVNSKVHSKYVKKTDHRSGAHFKNAEQALQYYADTFTMSIKQLNAKYPNFIKVLDERDLTKRRGNVRRRLRQEGIEYKHLEK